MKYRKLCFVASLFYVFFVVVVVVAHYCEIQPVLGCEFWGWKVVPPPPILVPKYNGGGEGVLPVKPLPPIKKNYIQLIQIH